MRQLPLELFYIFLLHEHAQKTWASITMLKEEFILIEQDYNSEQYYYRTVSVCAYERVVLYCYLRRCSNTLQVATTVSATWEAYSMLSIPTHENFQVGIVSFG